MRVPTLSRRTPKSYQPSSVVSVMRLLFPTVLLLWFLLYTLARPAPTVKLRGSQHYELPPTLPGDTSQTRMGLENAPRRKHLVPYHAVIVAGHAVVRLNKMATAGDAQ